MRISHMSLILAAAALVPVAQAGAATHHSASKACSTRGLHYSYRSGSVTFGDKVVRLHSKGVQCRTARSVASKVAKDLLHNRSVPHKIDGLTVRVSSCSGCAPDWQVSATRRGGKVTFHVLGGQ
jgi:hypothetical protein